MPDQIIREIPLIKRYSRHNEAEDYRFRTFLKGGLDLSNAELDAVVRKTTDEVWQQIDCTACANCCRTMHIVVDNKDIARLAGRLNMTVLQFSKRYVTVAEDKTKQFSSIPCPFLGEDNLCTVYDDRPKACRDFPFLHGDNFRSRTLGVIAHTSDCPIVFNVWQALKKRFKGRKRHS
jgi:uncharacterized protein